MSNDGSDMVKYSQAQISEYTSADIFTEIPKSDEGKLNCRVRIYR